MLQFICIVAFAACAKAVDTSGVTTNYNNNTWSILSQISDGDKLVSPTSASIGTFHPLDCNVNLAEADCSNNQVSSLYQEGEILEIPCGECWEWDLTNTTLSGINIRGKLYFKQNFQAEIYTPFVIVQGELQVESNSIVSPENVGPRFILTGTDDILFLPTDSPNIGACDEQPNNECNLGKKPFLIAGGKMNLQGPPSNCNMFTTIKRKEHVKPFKNPDEYPKFITLPNACPTDGIHYISENFEYDIGDWSCRYECSVIHDGDEKALVGYNRIYSNRGPLLDFSNLLPRSCLVVGQEYLFSVRIKLDRVDMSGEPTTCKSSGSYCTKLYSDIRDNLSSSKFTRKIETMKKNQAANYGEYSDFTGSIVFSEDELSFDDATYMIFFEGPEEGVNMTIDDFSLSLPDATSYPAQDDVCKDLILNGEVNGNGFNPHPFRKNYSNDRLVVMEENGNKYFRLSNRSRYYSSVSADIDVSCLDKGVVYAVSFDVRIHSDDDQAYYIQLNGKVPSGSWKYKTILECSGQNFDDGWVTCNGELTIDDEMSTYQESYFRLVMKNSADGLFTLDFDNMMIRYHKGYVNKLIVDTEDVSCWGMNSRIHITSSIFYSWSVKKNGYEGDLIDVQPQLDGTTHLLIHEAPVEPIITEEDDANTAAVVALLSRNIKIEGAINDAEEEGKGGYMQILHTPNVTQTIEGVEFYNMGRSGEVDRFALQFLYCGTIVGSSVSKISVRNSHHRCVVLEGTSNVTISNNIGHMSAGHCIYIGYRSSFNTIESNLVSETKRAQSRISGEGDNYPSSFMIYFPPNVYINNRAIASSDTGFNFYSDSKVRNEDGTNDYSINPRKLSIVLFEANFASSNGNQGFQFSYNEQQNDLILNKMTSFKNRYYGLRMYYGYRIHINEGFFYENGKGLDLRWSDNIQITDTVIGGLSQATKTMVKPPYFNKPCETTGFESPIGYRMQTALRYPDDANTGATLRNVAFVDFDNEECVGSFPITFNTDDRRDGHWDYLTAFDNVSFDTSPFIDAESAIGMGTNNIVITDIGGKSDPLGQATETAVFVSTTSVMKAFLGEQCVDYPGNISYCPGSCLRTVSLYVDQSETKDWVLNVQDGDGVNNVVEDIYRYDDDVEEKQLEGNKRRFAVSLPSGDFSLQFYDGNGELSWPKFAYEKWEGIPQCSEHANAVDVELYAPSQFTCDDLIENGDIESDIIAPWLARNGKIEIIGGGIDGSNALRNFDRGSKYDAPGQNLDTRCINEKFGIGQEYFEIKAFFRLEQEGETFSCDPFGSGLLTCPSSTFKRQFYDSETKETLSTSYTSYQATAVVPYNGDEFSLIHGVLKLDEIYKKSHQVFFYLERTDASVDVIVDDVSIKPMDLNICDHNLVRNGGLDSGFSSFWTRYGTVKFEMLQYDGNYALKAFGRYRSDHGPRLDIYADCLQINDRYEVKGRYFMQNFDSGEAVSCDRTVTDGEHECSVIYIRSSPSQEGGFYTTTKIASTVAVHEDFSDGWNLLSGVYTVSEAHLDAKNLYLSLQDSHFSNDVIWDDISITPIPIDCDNLILNPSFNDGTASFWLPKSTTRGSTTVILPGSEGAGYGLLFQHSNKYYGLYQNLDPRCFIEGQEYIIEGNFKLLNTTDLSEGLMCDPNIQNLGDSNHCPSVRLYGSECDGNNEDFRLWNDIPFFQWDPLNFNPYRLGFVISSNLASCKKIEVQLAYYLPVERALAIDDFQMKLKTAVIPTVSPSHEPTPQGNIIPTFSPSESTEFPSVIGISCPQVGDEQLELNTGPTMIFVADQGVLCTILRVEYNIDGSTKSMTTIARSYDTNMWEVTASQFAPSPESLICYTNGCQINLPTRNDDSKYFISASTRQILSESEEFARFFEAVSFGTTLNDLDYIQSFNVGNTKNTPFSKMTKWIENQMNEDMTPMTSHRRFWRKRINSRTPKPTSMGLSGGHPCKALSRWRKVAFVFNEVRSEASRIFHVSGNGPYVLYLNSYPRTVVNSLVVEEDGFSNYTFDPNYDYEICKGYGIDVGVGGALRIKLEDGLCYTTRNPIVNFTGYEHLPSYVLNFPNDPNLFMPIDSFRTGGSEFVLTSDFDDSICNEIPDVTQDGDEPIFGMLPDGSWLQFDSRIQLETNTVESPLEDGGKSNKVISGGATFCSNTPRTFLNEDYCEIMTKADACSPTSGNGAIQIDLNNDTISNLYDLTSRYVYAITGLAVVDQLGNEIAHPCTPGLRSRWERKDTSLCDPSSISFTTNQTLTSLLYSSTDSNPYIRDIYFPEMNTCDSSDIDPMMELIVDNTCWKRVHHDYLSIYDMSYWVENHPGGAFHIEKWADLFNSTFLVFPSIHPSNPLANHPITRWDNHYHKFPFVGRFGDEILIQDLPTKLRTDLVLQYYDEDSDIDNSNEDGVIVCGSPNEVENDVNEGFVFDSYFTDSISTNHRNTGENRGHVWTMIALQASDQLRQRVAFALSQILVVVPDQIGDSAHRTEAYLSYYDIFVKNAFGNYRNVLREISYHSHMAENLSYLRSKSSAYLWERYRQKAQADENFAREIMQLFSIGIVELNQDGTSKKDSEGQDILSYSNDDITSFSRAWTGFDQQPHRGNIEGTENHIDPMKITADWRDRFPKSAWNGYIGDGYPVCADFPLRQFLRKGATYRISPASVVSGQRNYVHRYGSMDTPTTLILDQASELRHHLCNQSKSSIKGSCQFANSVTLESNLNCVGNECNIDTVGIIQVADGVFYEYIAPPCVQFSFYNNAKKLSQRYRTYANICGNPLLPDASEACCTFGSSDATRHNLFDGEIMTFDSARRRCEDNSKQMCDFNTVLGDSNKNAGFFWTTDPCLLRIKVLANGYVAIIHEPSDYSSKVLHVDDENENYFKVFWDGEYPKVSSGCDGLCQQLADNSCLCNTHTTTSRVYSTMPKGIVDADSKLTIGAIDPNSFDNGTFNSRYDSATKITVHYKSREHDADTIYEYVDDKGRHKFMKNMKSSVSVYGTNGVATGYSFRNVPQFNSFISSQTNVWNAHYETEATLDKYFYHDNLAPFLAYRLIQRLVTSNPSPRYVQVVANAFKTGAYGSSFGTGNYGDIAATVAAVLLDREARNPILDADPTHGLLKEPILKVTAIMRGMEFSTDQSLTRLNDMDRKIGQMAHEFPSVFSFFLPEFVPSGHVGNAGLVSPEAQLLDMPKVVGLLNGIFSLINYGLNHCYNGFGDYYSNSCKHYLKTTGSLKYNVTTSGSSFFSESFEGPSLNGGLDNVWIGYDWRANNGEAVEDPHSNVTNHVLHLTSTSSPYFISPTFPTDSTGNTVVKFRYFSQNSGAGGCIGFIDDDTFPSYWVNWMFCDGPSHYAENVMTSGGEWISCQFELPTDEYSSFRIAISDRRGAAGDAYFDDIQIDQNNDGTTCSNVFIDEKDPPGQIGYSETVVENLALILTSGRLNSESKQIIANAFDKAGSAEDGLRVAQQLIVTTPEFHSSNMVKPTQEIREPYEFPPSTLKPYKAVVYIMFSGGCDSYNMLVPHTCTKGKDMYAEYKDVRQNVALAKDIILPIEADDQICETFGVHPSLPIIRDLYNEEDLLFFANTGVLTKPVNKQNYNLQTKTQLFAHNAMQREVKRLDPNEFVSGTGIAGRMADALSSDGSNVGLFSIDRLSEAVVGKSSESIILSSRGGVPDIYISDEMVNTTKILMNSTEVDSGFFGETWSEQLLRSFDVNELLKSKIQDAVTHTAFPETSLGRQLETVAKVISTREDRGVDKDFFYVEIGGFDTHADVEELLAMRFEEVNSAIEAFQSELKHPEVDLWLNVTTMQVSDFARTLNPNSGEGTDHAWGGNYILFGGAVKGKQIKGEYPDNLTDDGEITLGRGRMIPTTPWDACFRSIALWLGISFEDLDNVCINCANFPSSMLYGRQDLFIPTGEPTPSPTAVPSTSASSLPTSRSNSPSGNPTLSVKPTVMLSWNLITYDDFESGWGSFKSGGGDATIWKRQHRKKTKGKASLRIRDNSGKKSSVIYNTSINVSAVSKVRVKFTYIVHRFNNGEDFMLEINTGGRKWDVQKSWARGSEFTELKKWYKNVEVVIDTSELDSLKFRFRCDASSNRDQVFIDNVYVESWGKVS